MPKMQIRIGMKLSRTHAFLSNVTCVFHSKCAKIIKYLGVKK